MNTISNRSHTSNQTFPETVMLFDDFIKARHLDTSRTHTQNDIIDTSKEESSKKNTKRQKKQLSPLSARVFDTETNRNVINLLTEYKSLSTRQFDFNQNSLTMSTTNPRKTNRNITTNQCMTSLSEGPYRDIVSSIYSKRSQIVPSEKRKERPLSENERTYFKNILFLKKKEQDIKTLKEKLLEKEKLNCSFIPKLTQSTKKINSLAELVKHQQDQSRINSVPSSSDEGLSIINPTSLAIETDDITSIRNYGFYSHSQLVSISAPNCVYIGANAFTSCTKLTTAWFPNCTSVSGGSACFTGALSIAKAALGIPTVPTAHPFKKAAANLESVYFPNASLIGSSAFTNNKKLHTVNAPKAATISANAFQSCTSLANLTLGLSIVDRTNHRIAIKSAI